MPSALAVDAKPTDGRTQRDGLDESPPPPGNRLTAFFCKLRPSRRPERGGTARETTDSGGELESRCSFLARQQQHRRQRQALKRSGDFLGVTGANPYTGVLDIITPPTSSSEEDGVSSCVSSSVIPRSSLLAGLSRDARDACDKYEMAVAKRKARIEKEERRLTRAEERKEIVREVVRQSGVKWTKGEEEWSSAEGVRELMSHRGSGIVESLLGGVATVDRDSFLEMTAAVVKAMDECHRRRSRSGTGEMGMALVQRRQPQRSRPRRLQENGDLPGRRLLLRKKPNRFKILAHRRPGTYQQKPNTLSPEHQLEQESDNSIDFPTS